MSHIEEKKAVEQPRRAAYARQEITKLGYELSLDNGVVLEFNYKGSPVRFYPYTGWATGRTIKDGRGIARLLKQIKNQ